MARIIFIFKGKPYPLPSEALSTASPGIAPHSQRNSSLTGFPLLMSGHSWKSPPPPPPTHTHWHQCTRSFEIQHSVNELAKQWKAMNVCSLENKLWLLNRNAVIPRQDRKAGRFLLRILNCGGGEVSGRAVGLHFWCCRWNQMLLVLKGNVLIL